MKHFEAVVLEKDKVEYQDMPTPRQFLPQLSYLSSGSNVE